MSFTMSIEDKQTTIGLTCLKCRTLYQTIPSMNDMIVCRERKWVIRSICAKCEFAEVDEEEDEEGIPLEHSSGIREVNQEIKKRYNEEEEEKDHEGETYDEFIKRTEIY